MNIARGIRICVVVFFAGCSLSVVAIDNEKKPAHETVYSDSSFGLEGGSSQQRDSLVDNQRTVENCPENCDDINWCAGLKEKHCKNVIDHPTKFYCTPGRHAKIKENYAKGEGYLFGKPCGALENNFRVRWHNFVMYYSQHAQEQYKKGIMFFHQADTDDRIENEANEWEKFEKADDFWGKIKFLIHEIWLPSFVRDNYYFYLAPLGRQHPDDETARWDAGTICAHPTPVLRPTQRFLYRAGLISSMFLTPLIAYGVYKKYGKTIAEKFNAVKEYTGKNISKMSALRSA